jgi:hypothetical protein
LFIFTTASVKIFAFVYVDDILLTGSSTTAVNSLIKTLSIDFLVKDLGSLNFFLGVEVNHVAAGMILTQQGYITDILSRTNMSFVKLITFPMSAATPLSKFSGSKFSDPTLYCQTVGSLQYLSLTRPDIRFTISKVSQFMHEPRDVHWIAVKRILWYLKSTIDYGLLIQKCSSFQIYAYFDVDWSGCLDDRKSTSSYCIFLGKNLLFWSSKKQPIVSCSSTEAEYKAIANVIVEILWIKSLFCELAISLSTTPLIYCDNIGATYLFSNPAFHARTKHIEIDYYFVWDLVAEKALIVKLLSSHH